MTRSGKRSTTRSRFAALVAALLTPSLLGLAASPGRACDPVEGLQPLLKPRSVLVLGELHGTAEVPAFVSNAACLALEAGLSVTVALELPVADENTVAELLDSESFAEEGSGLEMQAFWRLSKDGRASQAMRLLLQTLSTMRRSGERVRVRHFSLQASSSQERDRLMASTLVSLVDSSADDLVVVLTGNIHSRIVQGTRWDEAYEPMMYLAKSKLGRPLTSLTLSHAGGSAWMCLAGEVGCGPVELRGRKNASAEPRLTLVPGGQSGHDGYFEVGPITASPPAFR